jgi:crotonobetainyl-CoA:carnitine CoA-transferase CaiB-like acyl-CoA transferase
MENGEGKLKGFRVVEFATYVAGPAATRVLADWGAEVIKVESFAGDGYRSNCRIYDAPSERNDVDPCFDVCNVNKTFISVDLRTEEGQEIIHSLLKDADVFLTNTRFQSLEKLGLLYEQIKDRYP